MAAAPPPHDEVRAMTCAVEPAPATWSLVPAMDHNRLNSVPLLWRKRVMQPFIGAELEICADKSYRWLFSLAPGDVVHAADLEMFLALRYVTHAECNTSVRTSSGFAAICVYVRNAETDAQTMMPLPGSVPAPINGASYTDVVRASCADQLRDMRRAAQAALQ